MAGVNLELFRKCTLGTAMMNALDEMIEEGKLSPEVAIRVVEQFDKSMIEALASVKAKTTFKGHLDQYRYCEGVWTFVLKDSIFIADGETHHVPKVKVVAADAKLVKQ